jgi:hypothetical protein
VVFGVTLALNMRDSAVVRKVARQYRMQIWSHAAVAAALVASARAPLLSVTVVLSQMFGASVAFAQARRELLPYAAIPRTVREAEIGPRPTLPGGPLAQGGPFLIVLLAAIYMGTHWAQVPPRFPTHWNLFGQPDGWTQKSPGGLLSMLWLGFVACGLSLTTSYGVVHWSRLTRVTGASGDADRRVRHANLLMLLVGEYVVAALIAWVLVAPTMARSSDHLPLAFRVAPFVLGAAGIATIAWLRVRVLRAQDDAIVVGDSTPDACWRWGQFYWNADDPAVFVERRFGWGYTLNFGNRRAWLLICLVVLALVLPSFFGV